MVDLQIYQIGPQEKKIWSIEDEGGGRKEDNFDTNIVFLLLFRRTQHTYDAKAKKNDIILFSKY